MLAAGSALALLGCSRSPAEAAREPAPSAVPSPAPGPAAPAGSRVEKEAFRVALEPPGGAKAGEAATARIVVTARGSYHVNRDYPMAFRPDATSTARFAGERVSLGEGAVWTACAATPGEACEVSAPFGFTAPAGGDSRLSGTAAFSVCNPDRCLIEKVSLSASVPSR